MANVAGKYDCTISIIDSENAISEANYEDYGLVTGQPFTMDVEQSAIEKMSSPLRTAR